MQISLVHLRKVVPIFLVVFLVAFTVEITLRVVGYIYLNRLYADLSAAQFGDNGDKITVVCLGESSTAELGVAWQDSYPKQLEKKLRKFFTIVM
ncbi:MAG: hypothetical protein ABIE75_01255 [Candidatus Omnitrophota bacterium]